jgi:hypothetical protein
VKWSRGRTINDKVVQEIKKNILSEQGHDQVIIIPMAKSLINGGKINEKYFRYGVHLTPEGSQQFACYQKQ